MPFPIRPKECYLTCRDRDDGGGAQISARISAMICARLKSLTYAHSPVADVAHISAGFDPGSWDRAWEEFFNLGEGETTAREIEARGYPVVTVAKPHRWFFPRSRRLHVVAHCHRLTNLHPRAWDEIAPRLAEKYHATPKPQLDGYDDGRVQIAIHLRRGDVGPSGRFSERFTSDENVLSRVRQVIEILGPENATIRLFSQGAADDFRTFTELGVRLHLDECEFETFHHFVRSNILFMAKSTFSYLGGVIGRKICIYEPFWHPPLPGWFAEDIRKAELLEALRRVKPRA